MKKISITGKRIHFYLTIENYQKLKDISLKNDMSMSLIIQNLLQDNVILSYENRKIVETEAKNLNVSINNFVNYLVSLFGSVGDSGINATIKKEV